MPLLLSCAHEASTPHDEYELGVVAAGMELNAGRPVIYTTVAFINGVVGRDSETGLPLVSIGSCTDQRMQFVAGYNLTVRKVLAARAPSTKPANDERFLLNASIGQLGHLKGRFSGPGKEADFIVVQNEPVYLKLDAVSAAARPNYGDEVEVDGVLEHYADPRHTPDDPRSFQKSPDHYFIKNPKIRVLN